MPKAYSYPENTESVLYIPNAHDQVGFGHLFNAVEAYFGEYTRLDLLRIEYVRWTHEEPCNCCVGSGVYGDFYRIELVEVGDVYTSDIEVRKLVCE